MRSSKNQNALKPGLGYLTRFYKGQNLYGGKILLIWFYFGELDIVTEMIACNTRKLVLTACCKVGWYALLKVKLLVLYNSHYNLY